MSKNDPSPVILQVHSGCNLEPVAGQRIVLKQRRWERHINDGHKETANRLHDIEYTLRSPDYVAGSMDGPGGKNTGGLCFVRRDATPSMGIGGVTITQAIREPRRITYLHVMVQGDEEGPYVATALFTDNHHKEIQWNNPTPGAVRRDDEGSLRANYDEEADILYLSVGDNVPAYSDTGADGLILRHALEDDRACGVTVMSFQDWSDHRDALATHVAAFLHLEFSVAKRRIDALSPAATH